MDPIIGRNGLSLIPLSLDLEPDRNPCLWKPRRNAQGMAHFPITMEKDIFSEALTLEPDPEPAPLLDACKNFVFYRMLWEQVALGPHEVSAELGRLPCPGTDVEYITLRKKNKI
ncbi:hypothetical protein NHX12_011163 [Muraenolepis orangiensis]|uniref:Uncharacterized protein n=1 Tax=Muraenolepis orangiensis TaxID=630683 RepID=A0A9Q0DH61_9TELE|nr:hypothetical protein NHX12_011163 [Muraenolepis orangiensis]